MSNRGAGYTFGSGVVYKFLETNGMSHILRAHQLCMEGYASLFDGHLSTVWSAPNYCYRCGNSASILEVSPGEVMYFNVFQAAPENDRDGPSHQAIHNPGGTVRPHPSVVLSPPLTLPTASGILPVNVQVVFIGSMTIYECSTSIKIDFTQNSHAYKLSLVLSILERALSVFQFLGRPSIGRRRATQCYGTLR